MPPVPLPPAAAAASDFSGLGESQREAAQAIRAALAERHAFVALTGDDGLGKSTLLAMAVTALPGLPLRVLRIGDPDQVSAESAARIEQVALERPEQTREGERHTVLVVDDAQKASPELLRLLTRIARLGRRNPPSPQVILAGRPALWDRLASPEFEPLADRLTIRPALRPMSDDDANRLIKTLLDQPRRVTGQMLTPEAQQEVLRLAQGRPERIGTLVRSTLTLGDIESRPPISGEMIRSAAAALDGLPRRRAGLRPAALAAGLVLAAVLLAGGGALATHGWRPERVLDAARSLANRALAWWAPATERTRAATATSPAIRQAQAEPPPVAALPAPAESPAAAPAATQPEPTARSLRQNSADHSLAATDPPAQAVPPAAAASASVAARPKLVEAEPPAPASVAVSNARPLPTGAMPSALSPAMVLTLLRRGDEVMAVGDYASARRFYDRAASAGSARGARGMARTYDPAVVGEGSTAADPAAAATWYGVAATLGDPDASARLQQLKAER